MSNGHRVRLVLSILETDTTFHRETVRGETLWVGRCLFCQAKLTVPLSGEADPRVTVEHIVPRHHGGTDDPENLALACARCNGEKGRRHDNRDRQDARRLEVTRALLERRKERWPASARPPRWPSVDGAPDAPAAVSERAPAVAPVTIRSLHIYPLKSAAGIEVAEARVTDRGFAHDRRFMLVDGAGRFLSQRELPAMARLRTAIVGDTLRVTADGDAAIELPLAPTAGAALEVEIWGDRCEARLIDDGGWFARQLESACRLVYLPDDTLRPVDSEYAHHGEVVSFADGFPYLVLSEATVEELSERLGEPVSARRFRPNVLVTGCGPGAEDGWQRLRVGEVTFEVVKPCARCEIVNVDPETGARGKEPLATLATYRKQGRKVIVGQNALATSEGVVRVGDRVEVLA